MSDSAPTISSLKRQRRAVRNSVKRLLAASETSLEELKEEKDANILKAYLSELSTSLKQLHGVTMECVEALNTDDERDEDEMMAEHDSLKIAVCKLRGEFETKLAKLDVTQRKSILSSTAMEGSISQSTNLKMPKIVLPTFNGDLRKYNDWAALFENMVHLCDKFEPIQKLYYLKAALVDEAAEILADTPLNEAAYASAWAEVKRNYDNRRAIIAAHFSDIVNLKPIKNEAEIRESLRKVSAAMRGVTACGIDAVNLTTLVAFLVSNKLESMIRRDWERSLKDNSTHPTYEQLENYLKTVSFAYESSKTAKPIGSPKSEQRVEKTIERKEKKSAFVTSSKQYKCPLCEGAHLLVFCEKFLSKSVNDRYATVRQMRLCSNCLKPNHKPSECRLQSRCKRCGRNHNSVLHRDETPLGDGGGKKVKFEREEKEEWNNSAESGVTLTTTQIAKGVVATIKLLPTAVVYIMVNGRPVKARVLIDACSQSHLISETFVRRNGLTTARTNGSIVGIAPTAVDLTRMSRVTLKSRFNNFTMVIDADVVPKVPYEVPQSLIRRVSILHPNFHLADSDLKGNAVDILIGVEYANCCLLGDKRNFNGLWLENSQFGWIASGPIHTSARQVVSFCNLISSVEEQLQKFWEIEEVEPSAMKSFKYDECDRQFEKTFKRLENGRFSVSLPFIRDRECIANTYNQALTAVKRAEAKLDADTRALYINFMDEYESLRHMELVPVNQIYAKPSYYLPHHCVLRPESTSTKLRVVFNASAKNSSGCSLNDALLVGRPLQRELFDTLIAFRSHTVAFTADISKMYRCILVNEEDRDMQRILWRRNSNDRMKTYRLRTVTYGTSSASYLATKCLQTLAREVRINEPEVAHAIEHDFYMDDLLTGADNVETAREKQRKIHETLESAGFPLAKYVSNANALLSAMNPKQIERVKKINFTETASILGLRWDPVEDQLSIRFNENSKTPDKPAEITKRQILSYISRVYDPLGLLTPVTVNGKILMQDLWRAEVKWDSLIPQAIQRDFEQYRKNVSAVHKFQVPRPYSQSSFVKRQLIGFSDASAKAYCAVVYIRSEEEEGSSRSIIVCAKNRVAPMKAMTIPRLELLGAVLLVKLLVRVQETMKFNVNDTFAFCDSQVVLSWIRGPATKYEVFVRNRVAFIEERLPYSRWRYVKTEENPADLGTRGINARQFLVSSLWRVGPSWLTFNFVEHITLKVDNTLVEVPEIRKKKVFLNVVVQPSLQFLENSSSLTKCVNSISYAYRFINKTRNSSVVPNTLDLTVNERKSACTLLIKLTQSFYFREEVECSLNGCDLSNHSTLKSLNVFLCKDQLLRVGGRLSHSNYSYDIKHPIVIHSKSYLLFLYVLHIHNRYFHASLSFVCNQVRQKFWVIGGLQRLVKSTIYKCVRCTRIKAETSIQMMGDLPPARTNISRPFSHVGIDYAGYFRIKCTNHRSTKFNKVYVSFFVCFVTKAVHLEVVNDLTAEAFIAAFTRFTSRRGRPTVVYSDNATNFTGASKAIANKMSVEWRFSPPRSPHFGGLWEAAVKAGKAYLVRAVGERVLTLEEFNTVFAQIECILNSRPLCVYRNEAEFEPLTPFHFLIGGSCEENDFDDDSDRYPLSRRYQLVTEIIASFWRRWKASYLAQLQRRHKWGSRKPNIEVNDVVVEKGDQSGWSFGIVTAVYPGADGLVRVVDLKTASGTFRRSIAKIVKLPVHG